MSRLKPRLKHIPLDFLGEEWQDCVLTFRALKWDDIRDFDPETMDNARAIARMEEVMTAAFISGTGLDDDGNRIDLTADDIRDFDLETQGDLFRRLSGQADPNGGALADRLVGRKPLTPALTEILYRERFGLTDDEMRREPAESVALWLDVEQARRREEQKQTRSHGRP